jgi:sugar lactone lactonase YvrE
MDIRDSFSAAQMQSKLWLVQNLERCVNEYITADAMQGHRIWLLAGWHGLTNLLIRTRNQISVSEVRSFDIDPTCETIADTINNLWVWKAWEFKAHTADINQIEYKPKPDIVINSSVEHMTSNLWWTNIPKGTIVCLQASDMEDEDHVNKFSDPHELFRAYPVEELLYEGIKRFEFDDKAFYRVMIIGVK